MIYKCKRCNKEYKSKNHFKIHINKCSSESEVDKEKEFLMTLLGYDIKKFNEAISDYKNGHPINYIKDKYGISIINYVRLIGIKRSNSQSKKTSEYREKYKRTMTDKYGVDNPSKLEFVKEKKKETMIKNFGYENNFCNTSIRINAQNRIDYKVVQNSRQKNLQKKYGKEIYNPAQIPGVSDKISKGLKKYYSKFSKEERRQLTEYARSHVSYVSNLELRIQDILNKLGIEYTANGFLYSYNWDLIFKNKVILEIQGDFWHGNPSIYDKTDTLVRGLTAGNVWEKDNRKRKKLEDNGYRIHYLWEKDLNNMSDYDIINFLKAILT